MQIDLKPNRARFRFVSTVKGPNPTEIYRQGMARKIVAYKSTETG